MVVAVTNGTEGIPPSRTHLLGGKKYGGRTVGGKVQKGKNAKGNVRADQPDRRGTLKYRALSRYLHIVICGG